MNRIVAILGLAAGLAGCQTMGELARAVGPAKVSVTMKNGEKIEGTLLQSEEGQSLLQVSYGAVTLTSGDVESMKEVGPAPEAPAGPGRLSGWARCLRRASAQPWGAPLLQVPASVVGTGILRNVPYLSMRAGNFEFNVYGDPDRPAGLEVGVYGAVHSVSARRACLAALKAVLNDPADRAFVDTLNVNAAKAARNGLTFEVTPPTAPDAFGGWWITVYDEAALQEQRASEAELARITMARTQVRPAPGVAAWQPYELRLSRPAENASDRIYIRGVHRRDGAYVAPKAL